MRTADHVLSPYAAREFCAVGSPLTADAVRCCTLPCRRLRSLAHSLAQANEEVAAAPQEKPFGGAEGVARRLANARVAVRYLGRIFEEGCGFRETCAQGF